MEGKQEEKEQPMEWLIPHELSEQRLDKAVAQLAGVTRSQAVHLIVSGKVSISSQTVRDKKLRVKAGEHFCIDLLDKPNQDVCIGQDNIHFKVVYVDWHVIVVDKPSGLTVHPGAGQNSGTLVNGLVARFPEMANIDSRGTKWDSMRPGIVHRLDKETSGLMVVARTPTAYENLVSQLQHRAVQRNYLALVSGHVQADSGLIDAPIARSEKNATKMAITAFGKPAYTRYEVWSRFWQPYSASLLEVTLETGRTHQIRVHMAAIGHPVIGDLRYSSTNGTQSDLSQSDRSCRLFLHAHRLSFDHPLGPRMEFNSPLPKDLQDYLDTFGV